MRRSETSIAPALIASAAKGNGAARCLKGLPAVRRGLKVDLERRVETQVMDAAFICLGHLDPPAARVDKDFADLWHMTRQDRGEAANGVDILLDLGKPRVDRLADIIELGARVSLPAAIFARRKERDGLVVMLV